jgi:hypothetical protein
VDGSSRSRRIPNTDKKFTFVCGTSDFHFQKEKMTKFISIRDKSGSVSDRSGSDEKRSGKDRRTHRFPKLKYLLFAGRRARVRREEDWHGTFYFDRYSSNIFAAIVLILLLSVFDALLTLYLIDKGSTELNPIMSYFLFPQIRPLCLHGGKVFSNLYGSCPAVVISKCLAKEIGNARPKYFLLYHRRLHHCNRLGALFNLFCCFLTFGGQHLLY